jgi:hypothetical protein
VRGKESLRKLTRLLQRDPYARVMRPTIRRVNGGWAISFTVQRSRKQRRAGALTRRSAWMSAQTSPRVPIQSRACNKLGHLPQCPTAGRDTRSDDDRID